MSNTRVTCSVKELPEYQFVSMKLHEEVGGDLPYGELTVLMDKEEIDPSVEELSIDLLVNESQITLKAMVQNFHVRHNECRMELIIPSKKFFSELNSKEFSSYKDIVNSLCPYDVLNDVPEDANISGKLFQNNMTDYQFLLRYLMSGQSQCLPAFRFDGLYMVDFTKSPSDTLDAPALRRYLHLNVSHNKLKDIKATKNAFDINGVSSIHYNNTVYGLSSGLAGALCNYLQNQQLVGFLENSVPYDFPDFMEYRAGDLVKITGTDIEENNFVITHVDLDLLPQQIIHKCKFASL